jgi:3-oxoadipate enol-lactonase
MDAKPHDATIVTDDGCRIAMTMEGREGAPVLVLSSSLGATRALWDPVVPALAARHRVLRYDTRGHGASDAPAGDYTLERLGRDVLALLDAVGAARAHVCGISMGGMIAQWLAAEAPGRVDRLVLANTAAFMGPASAWDARIAAVRAGGMAALVDATVARWLTPAFRERAPDVAARVRAMILSIDPVGYVGCCAALRDMDLRPSTARIEAPTLLVTGSHDGSTPPSMQEAIAAALPSRPLVTALEAAHLTCVEQPDAFARAVLDHLG